jgi:hypothetical protein
MGQGGGCYPDPFGGGGGGSDGGSGGPDPTLFGNLIYDLPGYQNPSAQAYGVYLGCLSNGFQCDANGNYYNPDYSAQAQNQYNRLSTNAANDFGGGYSLDSTTCNLAGGHCNFAFACDDPSNCGLGRYVDGLHVECVGGGTDCPNDPDPPLWIHDDTVSPWISPNTFTFGTLFTGDFWEHGFVDLTGRTFFVGAFNP